MANLGQSPYLAAESTVISTGLNALAVAGRAVSGALDNSTDRALWAMVELAVTFAVAPSAGGGVELYLLPSIDGTNYADGDAATDPSPMSLAGVMTVRAVITLQRLVVPRLMIPPGFYKWHVINRTSQAFGASGHTLKERRWELEST